MPHPDQWRAWAAGHVARTRAAALDAVDALDAALGVQEIVTTATADMPVGFSADWADLLDTQPTTLDRIELQSKLRRLLGVTDPDPIPPEDPTT